MGAPKAYVSLPIFVIKFIYSMCNFLGYDNDKCTGWPKKV